MSALADGGPAQVLSVETALSIQSHPDKALAERLHAERPQASARPCSVSFWDGP